MPFAEDGSIIMLYYCRKGRFCVKLEHYIQVGQKRLRCGYTTGTAAAAATRAAAELLLQGSSCSVCCIETPAGIVVRTEPEGLRREGEWAVCGVRKDAGDDCDVTDGLLICARVRTRSDGEITIDGGEGVGRVTRPGLDQPIGNAAINSGPRSMIREQAEAALKAAGASGGLEVVIYVPEGERAAEKTFNPRLGIEGGISILGTSGIVRPMSEEALMASIHAEIKMLRAEGRAHLLVSPGNYGADFCRDALGLELDNAVQCSNFIGDTLDCAAGQGFQTCLLVGHIGKLVKCAAGVMNTHSRIADGRMEVLAAYAALCGGSRELILEMMNAVTTDSALEALKRENLLEDVMANVTEAAHRHLQRRAGEMQVEIVMFSKVYGLLGESHGAEALMQRLREEQRI